MSSENVSDSAADTGMTAAIEHVDDVSKRIKVSIDASRAMQEFNSLLQRVSSAASIKGFRPGKAPKHVVEKMHGDYLRSEMAEKLIASTLSSIIKQHSLSTVGMPMLDIVPWKQGDAFEYTAMVSLYPSPAVKDYKEIKVDAPKYEVADKDIDESIERLRKNKATLKRLEFRNTAQSGDVADMQVLVQVDGENDSRPEPVKATLGEGEIAPELEQGIIGMTVGESKDIEFTLPENHRNPKLRGKKAIYKVSLTALFEKVLPEVDDDFAKSLEFEVGTVLELRMKIRSSLEEEVERRTKTDAEVAVLDKIVSKNEFAVPQALIDEEIKSLVVRSGVVDPSQLDVRKLSVEPFRAGLGEIAIKRVRSAIVVDRIGELENIQASDQELEDYIKRIAVENQVREEDVRAYMSQEGRTNGLKVEIVRGKVMAWLLENAKVTYKKPEELPQPPATDATTSETA